MFKNYGDITKMDGSIIEPVDCIIGGSPCTTFSQAGNRTGFEGASGLFLHQIRLIKEMLVKTNGLYPRFMVLENVVGILSCNKGMDFHRVLMECINVAVRDKEQAIPDVPMPKDNKWPRSGILYDDLGRWSIAWRVHDAQYWGVAQRRRRIALVVDFRGMSAPEILFEPKGLSWNINTSNTQGETTPETFNGCSEESDRESNQIKNNSIFTYDARGNGDGKITATITGNHDNRITDYTNVVVENKPIVLDRASYNQGKNAKYDPYIEESEIVPTLIARGPHACCIKTEIPICIGNGQSHVTNNYTVDISQTLNCMHDPMTILEPKDFHYYVRRLTPLECTRLQGFPDHWVDIGDWIDSKGKKHKEADAPKYKAIGNSIALPFWRWLCKNIVNKLREDIGDYTPTMGSLFSGIGGFDLCWKECGGETLWFSEIEEFCIAVLKSHF